MWCYVFFYVTFKYGVKGGSVYVWLYSFPSVLLYILMGLTKCQIKHDKLYFASTLDLEHQNQQRTPLGELHISENKR